MLNKIKLPLKKLSFLRGNFILFNILYFAIMELIRDCPSMTVIVRCLYYRGDRNARFDYTEFMILIHLLRRKADNSVHVLPLTRINRLPVNTTSVQ